MAEVFISGKAALARFMEDRADNIRSVLAEGGERLSPYDASGRLSKSVRTEVVDGLASTSGVLSAAHYWRWTGNGRGPGKRPPTEPITAWAQVKLGLDEQQARSIAFVIARNIGEFGTIDHQLGGKNVFEAEIEEAQRFVPDLLKVFLRDAGNAQVQQFSKAFAA